jgi:CHAD domain-containing protein
METTVERELKLEPPDGFELPELDGVDLESRVFTSTYYDTPQHSLLRAGITLRRRVENGLSRWQLKLPRDGFARAELETVGGPVGPPDDLGKLLVAHRRYGGIEPVATLRTRRGGVRVSDGTRALADVTMDVVDVLDGGRATAHFTEIEVELVEGNEADLDRLGRILRRAGAKRSAGKPKLMRVLDLPEEDAPDRQAPALARLRRLLAQQLVELEAHDPGVRLGDDAEDVHKARVATRRSRALIRATRPMLGERLALLGDELKWLGAALGSVRDLDVLLEHLHVEASRLEDVDREHAAAIIAVLEEEREQARDVLLADLDSERYTALLERFSAAIASLPDLDVPGGVAPIAAEELARLRKAAKELGDEPPDDELHEVRIHAKRARYAAELLDGKKRDRYLDALKLLQDAIGLHQDAVVAEERLRAVAPPGTEIAAGRLIERERERRRQAREDYPAALDGALRAGRKAVG